MKKTVSISNVAVCHSTVITTYPQWSDYGCLTNALFVAYKNDEGKFVETTFVTEDLEGLDYYEVEILSCINPAEYYQYRFEQIYLNKAGYLAENGFIVRVVKGRKVPVSTEFTVQKVYDYKVPNTYGRAVIRYLDGVTESGDKVHVAADNTIIIGWDGSVETAKRMFAR